jgi:hypothetical protein
MGRKLAVLLGAAVVALAAAAAVIAAGRSGSSSPCTQSWTSAISGRPALAAVQRHSGIFLWRTGGSWHVSLSKAPSSLVGRVSADRPMHVSGVSSALRPALSAKARGVSLHAPSSRIGSFAFRATCASRISVSFAAAAKPNVFLGRARRPVSPRFVLSTAETTGVSGQIYSSGGCPNVKIGQTCPSAKPLHIAAKIEVMTAPASKTGGGQAQAVKTITSAADGSYSTTLEPGRYLLQSTGQPGPGGTAFTPVDVTVAPGVTTIADLTVDSGIR